MTQALIVVDYNNDFAAEGGALTCGAPARALDPAILKKIHDVYDNGGMIFIGNDHHDPNDPHDPERKLFPAHCVSGTWGCELYGESGKWLRERMAARDQRVRYIPKLRYSAFYGTHLDYALRSCDITELMIVGVCTDICVLHTVIDAVYAGYKVSVPRSCVATLPGFGQEWALNHMKNCLNVNIID